MCVLKYTAIILLVSSLIKLNHCEKCGESLHVESKNLWRILNGKPVEHGEFPWIALILRNDKPFCGGSLISDQWIITAASCVSSDKEKYEVILGSVNTTVRLYHDTIEEIISSDEYGPSRGVGYDIALVKLKQQMNFDISETYLRRVCVEGPVKDETPPTNCVALGWGDGGTSINSFVSKLTLNFVDREKCRKKYLNIDPNIDPNIDTKVICAAHDTTGHGVCSGDAGGPLLCPKDTPTRGKYWYIYGVASWGPRQCGQPGNFDIFTNVSYYYDWIKKVTGIKDKQLSETVY